MVGSIPGSQGIVTDDVALQEIMQVQVRTRIHLQGYHQGHGGGQTTEGIAIG